MIALFLVLGLGGLGEDAPALCPPMPGDDDDLKPGLVGEYFHVGQPMQDFPKLDKDAKPRFKRVDKQIDFLVTAGDFGATKLSDHFYVRWKGLLRAPRDGRYRFYTVSDDGSRLTVAGKKVVDNGGLHSMQEAAGEIELKKGDHEILLEYFENTDHAGLRLMWEGPEIAKDAVPSKALHHSKKLSPTEEERKLVGLAPEKEMARDVRRAEAEQKREEREKREEERKPPAPEPEKPKLPSLDPRVVKDGEPRPDVLGKVVNAFDDGPSTLLLVRTSGNSETPFYLRADTKRVYVELSRGEQRPSPGQQVYLWLKPGETDVALEARFFKDRK